MENNVKLGMSFPAIKPATPAAAAKEPAAKKPASTGTAKATAAPKASAVWNKGVVDKNLKSAAKATDTICAEITKKVLGHKSATLPEITDIGGLKKDDVMKLVEVLDAMGSATYSTACALRELFNKMQ